VWGEPQDVASPGWGLCRPDPQGGETRRSTCSATDDVRAGGQSQDCQCTRPHDPACDRRPRRRGDRVINRRKLLLLLGGAMTPPALGAQQKPVPVIGFLGSTSPAPYATQVAAFLRGLEETGYIEGQNVTIEYRWAEGRFEQLPALAADLVGRKVDVIAADAVT